jgi:hypothetical protein
MKRTLTILALAAAASLAFAGVAQANLLTIKRARNAAFNVERQECNHVPTCDRFAAGPCTRLDPQKVRCVGHIYGTNARVGAYDCHRQITVQIYDGSQDRYYKTGPRTCDHASSQGRPTRPPSP